MKCPYCGHIDTKVIDSREAQDLSSIRRRRECLKCAKRFTTFERAELIDLVIIKKDGRRERFDRNKILTGIVKACEKRPIGMEQIQRVVDEIEMELRNLDKIEIGSREIGEKIVQKLKVLDVVAYIRFASVYRSYDDVESFLKDIKEIKKVI